MSCPCGDHAEAPVRLPPDDCRVVPEAADRPAAESPADEVPPDGDLGEVHPFGDDHIAPPPAMRPARAADQGADVRVAGGERGERRPPVDLLLVVLISMGGERPPPHGSVGAVGWQGEAAEEAIARGDRGVRRAAGRVPPLIPGAGAGAIQFVPVGHGRRHERADDGDIGRLRDGDGGER